MSVLTLMVKVQNSIDYDTIVKYILHFKLEEIVLFDNLFNPDSKF